MNSALSRGYIEQQGRQGASAVPYAGNRILCRALNRFKLFVSAEDTSIGPHLVLDGMWEPWVTTCVFSNLQPAMNCVNVGANVGYYTLIMGACVGPQGHVWALECNPEIYQLCKDNIFLNGMDGWVEVLEKAGGAQPGTAKFEFTPKLPGSGLISRNSTPEGWGQIEVSVETVDNIVGDQRRVDFLMVDAEGSEPFVIEGAARTISQNPQMQILLEWAPAGFSNAHLFAEKMLKLGFVPSRVGLDGGRVPMTNKELFNVVGLEMIWFKHHKKA